MVRKVVETKSMTRGQALEAVQRSCEMLKDFVMTCRAANKPLPYDLSSLRETIETSSLDVASAAVPAATLSPPPAPTPTAARSMVEAPDTQADTALSSPLENMLQYDFGELEAVGDILSAIACSSSGAAAEGSAAPLNDAAAKIRSFCMKRKLQQSRGVVEFEALTKQRRLLKRVSNTGPCLLVGEQLDRRAARREKCRTKENVVKRRVELVAGLKKYVPGEMFTSAGSERKSVSMKAVQLLLMEEDSQILLGEEFYPGNLAIMSKDDLKMAALRVIDHRNAAR